MSRDLCRYFYVTHLLLQKSTKLFLNIFIDTEMKDRPNRGYVNTSFSTFCLLTLKVFYPLTYLLSNPFLPHKEIPKMLRYKGWKEYWFVWSIGRLRTAIMHFSLMPATIKSQRIRLQSHNNKNYVLRYVGSRRNRFNPSLIRCRIFSFHLGLSVKLSFVLGLNTKQNYFCMNDVDNCRI